MVGRVSRLRAVVVNQNAPVPASGSQRTAIPTDDLECARPRAQQRAHGRWFGMFEKPQHVSPCCGRGRPHSGNAWDFIPLTMIPLTELAVGNATGRADLARRNQMMARFDSTLTLSVGGFANLGEHLDRSLVFGIVVRIGGGMVHRQQFPITLDSIYVSCDMPPRLLTLPKT